MNFECFQSDVKKYNPVFAMNQSDVLQLWDYMYSHKMFLAPWEDEDFEKYVKNLRSMQVDELRFNAGLDLKNKDEVAKFINEESDNRYKFLFLNNDAVVYLYVGSNHGYYA